jgi:hypothetical protein
VKEVRLSNKGNGGGEERLNCNKGNGGNGGEEIN